MDNVTAMADRDAEAEALSKVPQATVFFWLIRSSAPRWERRCRILSTLIWGSDL